MFIETEEISDLPAVTARLYVFPFYILSSWGPKGEKGQWLFMPENVHGIT